ncbi:ankyrin repeat-containing domain protein [Xylaria longipes]|nr:ankyrin repeat-containing domain protein [Xylaria longipes]
MLAVQNRQNDVMRVLIESGAETEKKDFEGWTALMIAAMKGQLDMVEQLLYVGADRRATDDRGRTPRDWARDSGYPAIIELFNILDTID